MGMGHSLAAEFTQRQYLVGGNADFEALLDSRGLQSDREETKRAKWYTIKSHRFLNAAREAARDPGVYLLCTQNHTMAACNFPGGAGPLFAFFDPNFGQYHYDAVGEFPSWYWQHVSSIPNYDLRESILFKLSRV
jgi:hypothetical protein